MAQYIDKAALLAEIEELRKNAWESFQKGNSTEDQYYLRDGVIIDILSFLDTLEVREVDLEKEIEEQCTKVHQLAAGKELRDFAKYFVELGIKAQKEQILAKAEKVEISCASFAPLSSGNYKAGDKLIIIKEE